MPPEVDLTKGELHEFLDSTIDSQRSAHVAIIHLLQRYDINLDDLLQNGPNFSFPQVKYRDIAPRVGLNPALRGDDIGTFDIHRARIPTPLFKGIISDLEVIMNRYGVPSHQNKKATSMFLAPLFNRTVALFGSVIRNDSESIIPRAKTTGRIEHHLLVFGRESVLIIEAQCVLGTADERLDAIAHVIAECEACHRINESDNDSVDSDLPRLPIYGILYDGTSFEFFSFQWNATHPIFSRGVFRTPDSSYSRLAIEDYHSTSGLNFICALRPICETLFYFLLLGYTAGVNEKVEQCRREMEGNGPGETTPNRQEAKEHADRALVLAVDAAAKATVRNDACDEITETAIDHLRSPDYKLI